jgi:hypothetical protein
MNTYLILPDIRLQISQIWVSFYRGPNENHLLSMSSQSSDKYLYEYTKRFIYSLLYE